MKLCLGAGGWFWKGVLGWFWLVLVLVFREALPAADKQQALEDVKLKGVSGSARRVLVLLFLLLEKPRLQHL